MWKIFEFDELIGDWKQIWEGPDFDKAVQHREKELQENQYALILPDMPPPNNKEEIDQIVEQTLKVNKGNISMIMPGITIEIIKNTKPICNCGGRCFCVIDGGGSCRCEGEICTSFGCHWGVCPGNC